MCKFHYIIENWNAACQMRVGAIKMIFYLNILWEKTLHMFIIVRSFFRYFRFSPKQKQQQILDVKVQSRGIVQLQNRTICEKSCECKTSLQLYLRFVGVFCVGTCIHDRSETGCYQLHWSVLLRQVLRSHKINLRVYKERFLKKS